MKKEKKELIKKFKAVIEDLLKVVVEDLLDNYEKYTDEEKAQIQEIFEKVAALNTVLDKYDVETKFSWQEYFTAIGQYFNNINFSK